MAPLSDADRAQWAFGTGLPRQPCPRQNGFAERMIGLIWRRDIDHIVVLTEALAPDLAILWLLLQLIRTHRLLDKDAPVTRPRFSGSESSVHTRYSADDYARVQRFSVHTEVTDQTVTLELLP